MSDLPEGWMVAVQIGGRRVLLLRRGAEVLACDERCPHEGASLAAGELDGTSVTCVAHRWTFDLASGRCQNGPLDLATYRTRIEGDRVLVELPADGDPGPAGRP